MRPTSATFPVSRIMTPREDWLCWEQGGPRESVLDDNGQLRFDVIPVTSNGKLIGMLTDASFEVREIPLDWCLTHDTPVERLTGFFVERKRPACFLMCEGELVGIVTPADLNKPAARTAFYLRLAELEMRLAAFIRSLGMSEDEILTKVSGNRRDELQTIRADQRRGNVDVSVVEMLYLSDILNVVGRTKKAYRKLGFSSRSRFEQVTGGLNKLRCRVMHPVHPLLQDAGDELRRLHERIGRVEQLLARLSIG